MGPANTNFLMFKSGRVACQHLLSNVWGPLSTWKTGKKQNCKSSNAERMNRRKSKRKRKKKKKQKRRRERKMRRERAKNNSVTLFPLCLFFDSNALHLFVHVMFSIFSLFDNFCEFCVDFFKKKCYDWSFQGGSMKYLYSRHIHHTKNILSYLHIYTVSLHIYKLELYIYTTA